LLFSLAEKDWPDGGPEDGGSWEDSTGWAMGEGSKMKRSSNSKGGWSDDWSVNRGSNNDWLDWSWAVGGSRGRGIDSLTSVLDISDVAIAVSSVGDSLGATIGKSNMVLSVGVVSISGLRGSKVSTAVSISDSIVVVVGWDSVGVGGLSTVSWGWGISWSRGGVLGSSSGNGHKSEQSNKALKGKIENIRNLINVRL
jgi:hypothetical protein